ncbi:MAG TPA: M1 family aminopeptidase [Anaerolineaceae bacterium]|nr:M1 family aminopeptidase [Anaerolineaceae bacterium]HPN52402.1 M1 family aminopeptidase [Anaerolineaceae bacterium]
MDKKNSSAQAFSHHDGYLFHFCRNGIGKFLFLFCCLLLLSSFASACNLPVIPTAVSTATLTPVSYTSTPTAPAFTPTTAPTFTPEPSPTSTPTPVAKRSQYRFNVELNIYENSLNAEEVISYVSHSQSPLSHIMLAIPPKNYSEVFALKDLLISGQRMRYEWVDNNIRIPLSAPLLYGESVEIQILYRLKLPECYCEFGYTQYQINLGDWYPYVPPLADNGEWIIHKPGWVGEYIISDLADFSLQLNELPAEWKIASNARPDPGRTNLMTINNARNLALSLSSLFEIYEITENNVKIQVYAFSAHAEGAKAAQKTASESLALFSELFGPYPHPSLTIVDAVVPDGMEYDGLFLLSHQYFAEYDGTPKNYLTILAAHETAHQWFAGRIASDPVTEPWLDETLCTFSELLYFEKYLPDLAEWWQTFRIREYTPQGMVNQPATNFQAFRPYVNATYLRGALFLLKVRDLSSPEIFLQALGRYTLLFREKKASGLDFLTVLGDYYPVDALNTIKKDYFQEP